MLYSSKELSLQERIKNKNYFTQNIFGSAETEVLKVHYNWKNWLDLKAVKKKDKF